MALPYPPTIFTRRGEVDTATSWEEHFNLLWDGWLPGDAAPDQSYLFTAVVREELANFRDDPDVEDFRTALTDFVGEMILERADTDATPVSVTRYGAVGDGVTDDTAAIRAAIAGANGRPILFPVGTYNISGQLSIPSGTTLLGHGRLSEIRQVTTAPFVMLHSDGSSDITVRGLFLNGNRSNRQSGTTESVGDGTSKAIWFRAPDSAPCRNIVIEDVQVENMGDVGIMLFNVEHITIDRCRVHDTRRDGIDVWFNCRYVTITDCVVTECGDDCLSFAGDLSGHVGAGPVRDVTVVGGVLSQRSDTVYGRGVWIGGVDNLTLTGVVVADTHGHGIMVDQSYVAGYPSNRVVISNCVVEGGGDSSNLHSGISIIKGNDVVVQGCVVKDGYSNGIVVSAAALRVVLQNNTVTGGGHTAADGIECAAPGAMITGNKITGTPAYGIFLNGASDSVVTGNYLGDIGTSGAQTAIRVENTARAMVTNNNIVKGSGTVAFGVRLLGTSANCRVDGNRTTGLNADASFTDVTTAVNHVQPNVELVTKVASYTLAKTDSVVIGAAGTAITFTLPAATTVPAGKRLTIKNRGAAALALASAGGTLDGTTSGSLAQWESKSYVSDGTNWLAA